MTNGFRNVLKIVNDIKTIDDFLCLYSIEKRFFLTNVDSLLLFLIVSIRPNLSRSL